MPDAPKPDAAIVVEAIADRHRFTAARRGCRKGRNHDRHRQDGYRRGPHWVGDAGETSCLELQLGNDHAITLTVSETEAPSVDIWHGSGEHSFVRTDIEPGETLGSFREFVAAAFEPQPPDREERS
jgi:hypothetical protein